MFLASSSIAFSIAAIFGPLTLPFSDLPASRRAEAAAVPYDAATRPPEPPGSGDRRLRRPPSGLILEAGQAGQAESFAPLAHDLARGVQACRDDLVGDPLAGHQDYSSADHVAIRRRIITSDRPQHQSFFGA